ncbi:MAG: fasciclin domain-containing protein, partial [Ilumatobacteraceae bacterium]
AVVDGAVKLNGTTTVTATDIEACNGVIHVIDSVLLPASLSGALPDTGSSTSTMTVVALVLLVGGTLLAVGVRRRTITL